MSDKSTIEFEKSYKDPESSIAMDISKKGKPLLISFGGMPGGPMERPRFEFYRQSGKLNINKIFFRDLNQSWYHSGLPNISDSIDSTADYLNNLVKESGTNKTIIIGNSMGGYAAILFGVLINADIVHAFVPHTYIHQSDHIRHKEHVQKILDNYEDKFFDLKNILESYKGKTEINIYYDLTESLDETHAKHLEKFENTRLHAYKDKGGHSLVHYMRKSGKIQRILISSLDHSPENVALYFLSYLSPLMYNLKWAGNEIRNKLSTRHF